MEIQECPHCGRATSLSAATRADICPHCGRDMSPNSLEDVPMSFIGAYLFGGMLVSCVIMALVAYAFVSAAIAQPAPSACYMRCTEQARAYGWTRKQFEQCYARCQR